MYVIDPITVTDAVLASTNVTNEYDLYTATGVWSDGDRVLYQTADGDDVYEQLQGASATVTVSIASPAVVTWTGHAWSAGQPVKLTTTGALPTGLTAGTTYYVINTASNTFQLAATPGGAAINTSGSQSGVHTARANAIGKTPPDEPSYWVFVSKSNAWKMFDTENNTQTERADNITVSLEPVYIANGIFLGNMDANSVTVMVTDAVDGEVYNETYSLVLSNSGSSFWNWFFRRIRRRSVFLAVDLPMYANATIDIVIEKTGSTAKCGMCCIGPLEDLGLAKYGLARGIQDFSETTFDVDGVSSTVERNFAKEMEVDIEVDNDEVDSVANLFEESFRGRRLVWIASTLEKYRLTAVFGRFASFRVVIPGPRKSQCTVQIEGSV